MGREQQRIRGRDSALAVLRSALRSGARRGRLVVVRGPAGIGKTLLLEESGRRWRAQGVRVAEVHGGVGRGHYGVDAVVDALRRDFDRFRDPGLIDAISALMRLHRDDRNGHFPAVVAELSRVFGRIGRLGPTAVLIDDAVEIADPAALLIAARRPGCLVVAAVRAGTEPTRESAELLEMADQVLDLEPLAAEDIEAVAGEEPDESVHEALRAALGPLYGNPGTVLATLDALREEGRLTTRGDGITMADPASPIALPNDHDLLRSARRLGDLAPKLLAAAAFSGTLDIGDLPLVADALDEDLIECGRIVDRLAENGLLVGDEWGRVRCVCPALAAAITAEERATLRRLPAELRDGAADESDVDSSGVSPALVGVPRMTDPRSRFWSATEEKITELVSTGLTNRQIGSELGLSEKTVESHLTRLLAKTGCRSRVELVVKANREGRVWNRPGAEPGRRAA